ncbi:MAG: hypothetical protein HYV29_07670 [Ignavibacteriales bacterium]|nr:hypothetical protein [Ignavibacteriales bacterium]
MKQTDRNIIAPLLFTLIFCGITFGQSIHDPEERLFQYGARAGSFAGAYVSEMYDISSMYWNPSSISQMQRRTIVWNYQQGWNGRSKTELAAFPLTSGYTTSIALGVNAAQLLISDKSGNDRMTAVYGIDCALSFKIAPTFSAGILGSIKTHSMKNGSEWNASSSIGLLYAPSPEISYGMVFSGIGNTISFVTKDDSIFMVQSQLPKRLHLGLTMRFPSARSERIFSIILSNDKTFGQTGIRYNGGLEWSLSEFFDLRAGYVVSPTYAGAKYGLGTRTGGIQFDYALSPSTATNRFHEFTFAIVL